MNKERSLGVVLQYAQMALSIIISLIYTPIMLQILGKTEYGIYNVSSSIISYLSLLSLGFGASYIRFYSIYKKDEKQEEIRNMNGLYLLVFSIMGLCVMSGGLILAHNAEIFYNATYSSKEIHIAKVLMVFLAVNLAVSFPASVFVSYVTAQEKFIFQKLLNMGKTIIGPVVNIIFLYWGYGSIGMVISTTIISLVVDAINIYYCFNKLGMQVSFKSPNISLLKDIFTFSIFIAINQLVSQINWQTDKIILGKLCSGSAVAIYAIGSQLNALYINFSTAVSSVFVPQINNIVSQNDADMNERLTDLMIMVGRVQVFLISLVLMGFVFFGRDFISFWAGEGFENSYYIALLLMMPMFVPLIQNLGIEIQRAKNMHQFRSIAYACMAVLNVIVTVFFVQKWGEIGAAAGTTISLVVANGFMMNIYYHKAVKIDMIRFWKSIFLIFPSFIIPALLGCLITKLYSCRGIFDFMFAILLFTFTYIVSIYYFGLNENEKNHVNKYLKAKK